jgi:hypothetical protein
VPYLVRQASTACIPALPAEYCLSSPCWLKLQFLTAQIDVQFLTSVNRWYAFVLWIFNARNSVVLDAGIGGYALQSQGRRLQQLPGLLK